MNNVMSINSNIGRRLFTVEKNLMKKCIIALKSGIRYLIRPLIQEYSILDVEPNILNYFSADNITEIELKRVKGHVVKRYEFTMEGYDHTHKLPSDNSRSFKITFTFVSMHGERVLKNLLQGALEFGFVNGVRGWNAVAFTKSNGRTYLITRTAPRSVKKSYTTSNIDIYSIFLNDAKEVCFPNGIPML